MALTSMSIASVTPRGGNSGQVIVVIGAGFGSVQGQVIVDPLNKHGGPFQAAINLWQQDRIEYVIPADLDDVVRDNRFYTINIVTSDGCDSIQHPLWVPSTTDQDLPATLLSNNAEPFAVNVPGELIAFVISGNPNQQFTFNAVEAVVDGVGPTLPPPAGTTLIFSFNGNPLETVTFAGTEASMALVLAAIAAQTTAGIGGTVTDGGGFFRFTSSQQGSGSLVDINAGTALPALGLTAAQTPSPGPNNVADITAVTLAEVITILGGLAGATAVDNGDGKVRIEHATPGSAESVQLDTTFQPANPNAFAAFDFPTGQQFGTDQPGFPPGFDYQWPEFEAETDEQDTDNPRRMQAVDINRLFDRILRIQATPGVPGPPGPSLPVITQPGLPTVAQVPTGTAALWQETGTGREYLVMNLGGGAVRAVEAS